MARTRILREEVPFAPPGEKTYGLKILREVWGDEATGRQKVYWKYGLPDGVQVLGLTEESGMVIAIEEWQPGPGTTYLHLVGESMERGETPLGAAARGLREETGYEAGELVYLSAIPENSGKSDRLIHCVLALRCRQAGVGEAEVRLRLLPPVEFWEKMVDYFTADPEQPHGGGNSLKAAALAFRKLGYLTLTVQT